MNKKITFSPHIIALTAIFVLGNGVIILPVSGADEFSFISYTISVLIMAALYLSVSFLWDKINSDWWLLPICIGALFCTANAFLSLTYFVATVILPATPKFFIVVILLLASLYFTIKRQENLLKFSLVAFVLIIAVVLFFFAAPVDKYDLRNIFIFRLPKFSELVTQIKCYVVNPVLHSLLLPIYIKLSFGETKSKQGTIGVLIGGILLGLCILSPILLFGAALSGNLEFPFSSAASTVTVGRLFTRLDGFVYFVFFVSTLIKITVCMSIVNLSLNKIRNK